MPSSYSPLLRLELMQTGEKSATWGDITNTNLGTLIEKGVAGTASVDVTVGDVTLTALNGADDEARCLIIAVSGTPGVTRSVTAPASSKSYVLINGSNASVVFKASATAGVVIAAGEKAFLAWGGSDYVRVTGPTVSPSFTGTTTVEQLTVGGATVLGDAPGDTVSIAGASISWTGSPTHSGNHTFSGNVTVQGNTTLGNNASADTLTVNAASTLTGNTTIGNVLNTSTHVINAATVTLNGTPSWRWNGGAYTLDFSGVGLVCNTTITTTAGGFATNGSVAGDTITAASTMRVGGTVYGILGVRDGGAYGGVGPNSNADGLVLESSGNTGISVLTPSSSVGQILFGNEVTNGAGGVTYTHSTGLLSLSAAGVTKFTIDGPNGHAIFRAVPSAAPTLAQNSSLTFALTSNTNLRIYARGTDGVTRTVNLTLA